MGLAAGERYWHSWENVEFVALPPGWENVFKEGGFLNRYPCPGLLIQEKRTTEILTSEGVPRTVRKEQPPYERRVLFADADEGGSICPAQEAENYVRTIGPGQALSGGSIALPPSGG